MANTNLHWSEGKLRIKMTYPTLQWVKSEMADLILKLQ